MAYQLGQIWVPEVEAKELRTRVPSRVELSEGAFVDLYVTYTEVCLERGREPLPAFYFMMSQGIQVR